MMNNGHWGLGTCEDFLHTSTFSQRGTLSANEKAGESAASAT